MKELNHCPSTLADGFSTYSPIACKKLFDGQKVSHLLDFEIDEISKTSETMTAMRRISVSGAQEKTVFALPLMEIWYILPRDLT